MDDDHCEDCGVHLDRHGSECGYELGDHAAGYFEEPSWVPAPQIVTLPAGEYL